MLNKPYISLYIYSLLYLTSVSPMEHQEESDDDYDVEQPEGKKELKQSIYPLISRRDHPCAIIINNESFGIKLPKRLGSQRDAQTRFYHWKRNLECISLFIKI